MIKATIGSISSGTLRDQDLLEAFASELERLEPADDGQPIGPSSDLIFEAFKLVERLNDNLIDELLGETQMTAGEVIADLETALNEYAPPYCYFRAVEGDGADFGFWPAIDALEEDARYGDDVLKTDDMEEVPNYVMHVNDHGNVTLYRIELIEEWACV